MAYNPRISADTVRRLRLEHGMTQIELAAAIGRSKQVVCDIENGRRHGGPMTQKRLAEVLEVKLSELYVPADRTPPTT